MTTSKRYKHLHVNKDPLLTNLQYLMHEKRVNEAHLSRQTDIPQPTLHKILSGKTNDPRVSTLKILAEYFNVTLDELYSSSKPLKSTMQSVSIPIISWAECIQFAKNIKNLPSTISEQWIIGGKPQSGFLYGLISKPSMEPFFLRGTILIVNPTSLLSDGNLVIIQYPHSTEATIRKLSLDGPKKLLISLTDNTEIDRLDQTIKIVGTVIESRILY